MTVEPAWLERILTRNERSEAVERVLSVEESSVVGKGDNYASDICRLRLEVVLGSGRMASKSLILKRIPDSEFRSKHLKQWGVFRREARMYTEIMPLAEQVLEEHGLKGEPLASKCLYFRPYDLLLLEDLKELGFSMEQRSTGLDYPHAEEAIRGLARFHGASVLLADKGLLEPSEYTHFLSRTDTTMTKNFIEASIERLCHVIDTTWEPEWKSYAEGLRRFSGSAMQTWIDMTAGDKGMFEVLNHGDFWLNNMMFRHHHKSRTPSGFRLVDLQMCCWGSPAVDWLYFTGTSLQTDVLLHHLDRLLATYHETLVSVLGARAPSLQELNQHILAKARFGLVVCTFFLPIMKTDPEDVMDVEELFRKADTDDKFAPSEKPYRNESFTRTIRILLKRFRKLSLV